MRAASDAALAPLDLPARPALMLLTLAERPLPQSTLGGCTGVDRTTMVAVVDDLVERGLVDRLADPADRRAYALTLTKAGRAAARTAAVRLQRAERDALAGLTDRQREQLLAGLRALLGE